MPKLALVVDDSRVARMTLKKLLTQHQFDVVELPSAEETLDYLKSDSPRPDVIFIDVLMSGMDGFAATKMIKALPSLHNMPIVICTGNDDNNKEKATDVGAMTALTKPPVVEELAKVMAQLDELSPVIKEIEPLDEVQIIEDIHEIDSKNIVDKIHIVEAAHVIDEAQLTAQVVADIESRLVPKIQQEAKEISTEVAQRLAQEVSLKTVQDSVADTAITAVQAILDEADITTQVGLFLTEKGEEWLEEQEEDLGVQLTTQMELLIPDIVSNHLEAHLEETMTPLLTTALENHIVRDELDNIIKEYLTKYAETEIKPIVEAVLAEQVIEQESLEQEDVIESLSQQLDVIKKITMGLAILVTGLIIIVL